ncbi:ABC transporter ATP-binding protein [Niameybacter massiliensis]|uniref:ABC transporter ATP-binding protein n=1 Tax=Holtiella tumoricola TaxID=3018743 RepID=A0AA42DLS3_9FIRM|nr:ABC transporter ATP-binding protein [Holtiella tumoricola]MDA3731126.1 ABC transporter ATP-binding protein [Holtiella tumoricola]
MLKRLLRVTPYFILAALTAALLAFADSYSFVKMMDLMDIALSGDMTNFRSASIDLIVMAIVLVPLCILVAITRALYKRKANLTIKHYYVNGVFNKNISEFQKENNAKYISCLTNDFNLLEVNLIDSLYEIGACIGNFAAGIWMMTIVSPWVILLAVGVMIVMIIFSTLTSKPTAKHMNERSTLFEGYTSYTKEMLSAFHIIKSNNLTERVQENFNDKSEQVQQKGYIVDRFLSYIQASENIIIGLMMYMMLAASGYMAIQGLITVGGAFLVVQSMQKVMWPVMNLSEQLPKMFTVKDLIKKIEKTLENEDNYEETQPMPSFNESITLKNVSFGYADQETDLILENINLELKKGGKYLIVGPSGGGKSTLLKLLRKYFNPTNGEILIDGYNLKDIKKNDFFSQVANVEQQVFIFEDTLRNNITLYKDYTEEEIEEAIRKSGLSDFVKGLSNGLDTMIYDNGKNISGGERSRVVIARGLLAKASIIFLDEAFAALDMERAKEIEKSILALEGVTVINVSHVLFNETRSKYDKILKVNHRQVEYV